MTKLKAKVKGVHDHLSLHIFTLKYFLSFIHKKKTLLRVDICRESDSCLFTIALRSWDTSPANTALLYVVVTFPKALHNK